MTLDNCICCRQKNDSSEELCVSCCPWNDVKELKRELVPVWQRLLQASFPEFIGEIGSEMIGLNLLIRNPIDEDWQRLLNKLCERKFDFQDPYQQLCLLDDIAMENLESEACKQNVPLFCGGEQRLLPESINGASGIGDFIQSFTIGENSVSLHASGVCIDGIDIYAGSSEILLKLLAISATQDGDEGHPARRFLWLHEELCRQFAQVAQNDSAHNNMVHAIAKHHFHPIGDPQTPPPVPGANWIPRKKPKPSPPLCDWSAEGYMLGVEIEGKGRRMLKLPNDPRLLEHFIRTWRGRHGSAVGIRLRAACFLWALMFGLETRNAAITPHERSFQLLRSIIESNPERITKSEFGLIVIGSSGVRWWLQPGRGAHGSPCIIAAIPQGFEEPQEDPDMHMSPICLYDADQALPMGDRLSSSLLGLLNDMESAARIPQIGYGIRGVLENLDQDWWD